MSWRIDLLNSTVSDWTVTRYDLLLGVIPAAFLLATLLVAVTTIPQEIAVGSAALMAAVAVGDGLFRNPPRRPVPHAG